MRGRVSLRRALRFWKSDSTCSWRRLTLSVMARNSSDSLKLLEQQLGA